MLTFHCAGCGATVSDWRAGTPPFTCPKAGAGGDFDHLVRPVHTAEGGFPGEHVEGNPFLHYRRLLSSSALARVRQVGDDRFVQLVRDLDAAVERVDGRGFAVTPFAASEELAGRLGVQAGEVWVKDETGNVSGSHKARHLFGIMLHMMVDSRGPSKPAQPRRGRPTLFDGDDDAGSPRAGLPGAADRPALAIASCGNAALAAAVIARAADRRLDVFVPVDANAQVLERLRDLDAAVHACERRGAAAGDPCYHAFRAAVAGGAIPFCCQGSDNGLAIDGGKTLAYEMVTAFRNRTPPRWAAKHLDAVFVQVGGGALASAVIEGFDDAVRAGAMDRPPRIYTVQTTGAYPLKRAYDLVAERILARVPLVIDQGFSPAADRERARLISNRPDLIDEEVRYARAHRSAFMRPWEKPPRSVAHGILDDETYDWAAVVEGMLRTGGWPLVVGEERLVEANQVARDATGIDVDHTGSAGLAGLIKALSIDDRLPSERVAVIFSGVKR